jgi:hypothetical protein
MAVGLLSTEQLMDTDPGAALATWTAYMHRITGWIRRQQKLRLRKWERHQAEARLTSRLLALTPDLSRGMGARLDALRRTRKREQLLEMALGVFDATGVVRLRPHRESDVRSVSDLLVYSLEELEAVAERKGGIRRLLNDKWRHVYRANAPLTLFSRREWRAA